MAKFGINDILNAKTKAAGQQDGNNGGYSDAGDGFMNIPDGIDEELPFN